MVLLGILSKRCNYFIKDAKGSQIDGCKFACETVKSLKSRGVKKPFSKLTDEMVTVASALARALEYNSSLDSSKVNITLAFYLI